MENPLSDEARLLRPSLAPGMLAMLAHNLNRDVREVRLFEQGSIFTGTAEQVTESLLDYWDLGVTTFLIRGFDPLEDAIAYGRELIPLVRQETAARRLARAS